MTRQDSQHAFDRQARAHYQHAASAISPALQGRLRAARRTALAAGDAGRRGEREPGRRQSWPVLPLAAMAAAVFALAIGLRWQRGADSGAIPPHEAPGPAIAVQTVADPRSPQGDVDKPQVPDNDAPDTAVADIDAPDTGMPEAVAPDMLVADTGVPGMVASDPDATERVAMESQASDDAVSGLSPEVDSALLMLDEDPDFYLWLGGDDELPASLEPAHDAT